MKTLVTGIGGFTGRYLADALLANDHEVHGIVHSRQIGVEDNIARYVCDLRDSAKLASCVEQVDPDYIIHLAAISFVAHGDPADIYQANLMGTRNILEAAKRARKLRAIVLASSANVYGNSRSGMLDENTPPEPANDYAVSKIAAEYIVKMYHELPCIVTRPFNYTGVGQSDKFLIPKIVKHCVLKEESIDLGNIDVSRDFSDVRDICQRYVSLLSAPSAIGGTFNLCTGRAISLSQILRLIEGISHHELDVKVNAEFVRENDVKYLCGSPENLEKVIGPLSSRPLNETLSWMVRAGLHALNPSS